MSTKTFIDRQLLQIHQGGREGLFKKMKRALPQILFRILGRKLGRYDANRELCVKLMLFALEYSSRYATFVSGTDRKLPAKNERMRKTNNILDDLVIIDDGGFNADEVNLIMRGKSFNFERSNMRENVYLLNGASPKYHNQHGENTRNCSNKKVLRTVNFPVTYVTCDGFHAAICMDNHVPMVFIDGVVRIDGEFLSQTEFSTKRGNIKEIEKYCSDRRDSFLIKAYHKNKCSTIMIGSGLFAALALSKLARKLNILGWDFYMESSPKHLNHKQALKALYNKELDKRLCGLFELTLTHWLFASRLKELDHVDIHGHLNDVSYHPKLISKISRVYYES